MTINTILMDSLGRGFSLVLLTQCDALFFPSLHRQRAEESGLEAKGLVRCPSRGCKSCHQTHQLGDGTRQ